MTDKKWYNYHDQVEGRINGIATHMAFANLAGRPMTVFDFLNIDETKREPHNEFTAEELELEIKRVKETTDLHAYIKEEDGHAPKCFGNGGR